MIPAHARLLQQLNDYVSEYVGYLATCGETCRAEVNDDLRRIIEELETLQAHPDQRAESERLAQRLSSQIDHLRALQHPAERRHASVPQPKRSLVQAFQEYIDQEVNYLLKVSGGARREQTNLLLGEIIADLKSLALHPTDQQATMITADLEAKRAQLQKLQRPWQQMLSGR